MSVKRLPDKNRRYKWAQFQSYQYLSVINKALSDMKFEEGKLALERKVKRSRTFNLAVPN